MRSDKHAWVMILLTLGTTAALTTLMLLVRWSVDIVAAAAASAAALAAVFASVSKSDRSS